mgnify:CR=1 FL=1
MASEKYLTTYDRLRQFTDARIGLKTTGSSLSTEELLKFQFDWAQARDAVYHTVDTDAMREELSRVGIPSVRVTSAASSRAVYLRRPDLGRILSDQGMAELSGLSKTAPDIAIVVADGLSGLAVSKHASTLVRTFRELAMNQGWSLSPVILVEQGRVAIGDPIGEAISARLTVTIIGERPGLSAADSLGVYITYNPSSERNDAERNCISNIRPGGQHPDTASSTMIYLIREALRMRLTGVNLKDNSQLAIEGNAH